MNGGVKLACKPPFISNPPSDEHPMLLARRRRARRPMLPDAGGQEDRCCPTQAGKKTDVARRRRAKTPMLSELLQSISQKNGRRVADIQ